MIDSIQEILEAQSEVILLKVISPMSGQTLGQVTITGSEREEGERTKELGYCDREDRFRCEVVDSKSVAEGITSFATAERVDLIAMYTHDRKGLARLIKGSIAAKVERGAPTEVRVLRPRELAEVGV